MSALALGLLPLLAACGGTDSKSAAGNGSSESGTTSATTTVDGATQLTVPDGVDNATKKQYIEENAIAVCMKKQGFTYTPHVQTSTAADRIGLRDVTRVLVDTALGAAKQVARQAPIALAPGHQDSLAVVAPPDLSKARAGVRNDTNSLFLVLGLASLVVGAIGIANVTLVTVMERVGEIGLRRSLGASRRQVAGQFLLESTTIGLLGGVVGAALGIAGRGRGRRLQGVDTGTGSTARPRRPARRRPGRTPRGALPLAARRPHGAGGRVARTVVEARPWIGDGGGGSSARRSAA